MKKVLIFFAACCFISCLNIGEKKHITIKNNLTTDRRETVSISGSQLVSLLKNNPSGAIVVKEESTGKIILSQLIDNNGDGSPDELIFQADFKALEKKKFTLLVSAEKVPAISPEERTFSRLVPERIDDFAWENNRVAFRTYGPEAQRLVDENQKGGTLSSGMDCWLKRVHYPIIDKWYKKYVDGGTYHKDSGEGYDPYHVGASRGCGGIGVWKNDSLYVSKNFTTAKIIANGPIRTIFELTYAAWFVDAITVQEKKTISVDLGSQLSRYEVKLESVGGTLPNCTAGITLHDKKGEVNVNVPQGWFRHWEPIDDSELGTGIVANPSAIQSHLDYRTAKKDLSQLYIIMKPATEYVYYAGFAWKKAGAITTAKDWDNYLDQYAKRLASPLEIVFEK